MPAKRFLFVMRKAPHQGILLSETLDVILTTAAFDQSVSLLFLDDGVFQLLKNQQAESTGSKDTLAMFNALPLYDIQDFYVEKESLSERGLKPEDLALIIKTVARQDIAHLSRQFDRVI